MKNVRAVLVLLFFSCGVITAHAQSSSSNMQNPPPGPSPRPRATPQPSPRTGAAKSKKLIAIQPLPVFCVKDAVTPKETNIPCDLDAFEVKTGNGSDIAKKLSTGNFELELAGTDWIAIYCTKPGGCDEQAVQEKQKEISDQAWPDKPDVKFSREIEVPRKEAARIAPLVAKLNSAGITAEVVSDDRIRLKSDSLPNRDDLKTLEDRIRLAGWDREVAPPTQRMFELDAATVAKCLTSGCPDNGGNAPPGSADTTPASPKKGQTPGGTGDGTQQGTDQKTKQKKTSGNDGGTPPTTDQGTTDKGTDSGKKTDPGSKTGKGGTGTKGGTGKKGENGPGTKAGSGTGGKKSGIAPMLQPIRLIFDARTTQKGSSSSAGGAQGTHDATTGGGSPTRLPSPAVKAKRAKPKAEKPSPSPTPSATPSPSPDDSGNNDGSPGPDIKSDIKSVADMLVFSNSDGSDKGFWDKHRLMAILDLPRPEVLMNVWSFQASSGDPQLVKREFEEIRQTVSEHNDTLQNAIQYGWDYLSRSMGCVNNNTYTCDEKKEFFNQEFYNYITQRFVNDCPGCGKKDWGQEGVIGPPEWRQDWKDQFNICKDGKYCLGYVHAFDPVRPTLTNILLTMIAAEKPEIALATAICMEGDKNCFPNRGDLKTFLSEAQAEEDCHVKDAKAEKESGAMRSALERRPICPKQEKNTERQGHSDASGLDSETARLHKSYLLADQYKRDLKKKNQDEVEGVAKCIHNAITAKSTHFDCELEDRVALNAQFGAGIPETLQLACFKNQIAESLLSIDEISTFRADEISSLEHVEPGKLISNAASLAAKSNAYATTRLRLLRAAIADFLFNYKMATQYPHDFVPYDLDESAQELNAQLNPLIVAFNRDVAAFTEHLDAELSCKFPEARWWTGTNWVKGLFTRQKNTFLNNGEVMVRGISGVQSIVNTLTQSYFNATNPPSVTDLISSVGAAEGNLPGVLKSNLTANEAAVIVGALNSVKPAQAKIGRELDVEITPHTLAGASSAELDVKLTAKEDTDPTRFESGKDPASDSMSRVANHFTQTKVRVDSLKLFEVSSFSALLQRPRSKIPIVPPLFEVPYFGSFIGFPIPGAKEYHRSTAIVSAVIVPTAFDLAYGIDFTGDRVCEKIPSAVYPEAPKYECHHALRLDDLRRLPVRNFHKKLVECFASPSRCGPGGAAGITFTNVPPAD